MNWKLLSCIVFALHFFPMVGRAQMIDSMMNIYAERFPQEKLYLQFDKKAYNPGERIWFKAYLFTGFDPSPFSKNFYAELYDENGNLILRKTAPFSESTANGSFDLPASFEGTRIHIRAYTTWMLNFDTSFVYTKDLRIIGSAADSLAHPDPSPTSLRFFPEGGELIAGVENNIAFIANDSFGEPRKISGILYDQSGKSIYNFNSSHRGMGSFLLIPDKNDAFYAVWKDEFGKEYRTDLPAVNTSGIVLRVLNTNLKLVFSIARPSESLAYQQVIIIAHMNQQMVYKATVNLKDITMNGGTIPTQQLPTGILQITVFDVNQVPLAERICFINNDNYDFVGKLNVTSKSLQKRGRNVVELQIMDTTKSNMAVAVTDAEVDGNRPWGDNIVSSLLLTGELHGHVKDPYYYFQNNSDSLVRQLDLVMLTHGWRRFKWDDLTKGRTPVIKYPIDNYLSLNAEVLGVPSSRIAKDESMNVILQYRDSSSNMLSIPYTSNSKFKLPGLVFFDTVKTFYSFNLNKNLSNEAAIVIKNGLYVGGKKIKPFTLSLPVWSPDDSSLVRKSRQVFAEIARLQSQDKKIQNLEVVTVRRRVKSDKEKLDEEYSSGLFSGGNATIFDLMDDPSTYGSMDIFMFLQGRVAGLQVSNTQGPTPTLSWRGSTPGIYLNEIETDAGSIKNIAVNDIAMVKVFSPGSAGAMGNGTGGVIAVYTKKGASRKPDPSIKGLEMVRITGYSVKREFYSPDYLINPEPETDDIRTTLYWNPNLQTNIGKRTVSIPFYNSDVTHKIRIILEGFNADGKLIHLEKIIE